MLLPTHPTDAHVLLCFSTRLQVLVELPYVIVQSLLYGTVTYFLVHFEINAVKFWWYILFTFLTLLFFTYYGEQCGGGPRP
jgi:ABC-type multidrug transport system permease subunit